jgi:hypothetical protein
MANVLYPLWKQALMREFDHDKSLDQEDDNNSPYLSLVTILDGYEYSAGHQFYTSITNVVGTPVKLTGPVVAGTIFSADTAVYEDIVGTIIGAIVIHRKNPGINSTWRLVLYEDTGVIGLPLTANGGNIIVKWNSLGIFSLGAPA